MKWDYKSEHAIHFLRYTKYQNDSVNCRAKNCNYLYRPIIMIIFCPESAFVNNIHKSQYVKLHKSIEHEKQMESVQMKVPRYSILTERK